MRTLACTTAAATILLVMFGGDVLANTCQTDHYQCATTMPTDGYCECRAHGATEDGTVVAHPPPGRSTQHGTAGGCGAQPGAPGCR